MGIISKIFTTVIGSRNERLLKALQKTLEQINNYETVFKNLSDKALKEKTATLKNTLMQGASLDTILPESFALIREASIRVLALRHYDVQLLGGIVLHQGKIAEMATGEGKTLVATLPAYLNALSGESVHIVTVNDYLAKRDAQWMGRVFEFLDLSVGVVCSDMSPEDRENAYRADIVYATNNELGFDYLRDNMAFSHAHQVQRKLNFAIVDEVDSILIDEARTPLIISGPSDDYSDVYQNINHFITEFSQQKESGKGSDIVVEVEGDYTLEEKNKQVLLTERGHSKAESLLKKAKLLPEGASLYDANHILLMQHLNAALKAHVLYQKNVDYIVQDDEITIIDEFTGRKMLGRRWSEGLHQAVEAKEKVSIKKENQTLASITFQNYFRLYAKLAGMTGTAETEAHELQSIYSLEVVVIPPNKVSKRKDMSDMIYLTAVEKYDAIILDIKDCVVREQPVLVGTGSIESSELISKILTKTRINHEVLNAKQHEREAQIVANAGCLSAVTIATNMAGRGTDIVLGGKIIQEMSEEEQAKWQVHHDKVLAAGGLHIIGTERSESRRVDNQLRGRAARQGDIGSTRFYLSLEDNLMRIFASERVASLMSKLGMEKGEAIEHTMVNRAIENAQKKVEGHNFDARKQLLEYDDVANEQRSIIYQRRNELLGQTNLKDNLTAISKAVLSDIFYGYINTDMPENNWDAKGLRQILKSDFSLDIEIESLLVKGMTADALLEHILATSTHLFAEKERVVGSDAIHSFGKAVMLQTLDHFWKEHLGAMDYLRQSIGLRGYAQKNPVQEYKSDSFTMFKDLLHNINVEVVKILFSVHISDKQTEVAQVQTADMRGITYEHAQVDSLDSGAKNQQINQKTSQRTKHKPFVRPRHKIGRNEICDCGSGKKFKHCHGRKY